MITEYFDLTTDKDLPIKKSKWCGACMASGMSPLDRRCKVCVIEIDYDDEEDIDWKCCNENADDLIAYYINYGKDKMCWVCTKVVKKQLFVKYGRSE